MDDIKSKIKNIIENGNSDEFIFDFLMAYKIPKSLVSRARKGALNKLDEKGEFTIRKKILFKIGSSDSLYSELDHIKNTLGNSKRDPRFILITDFQKVISYDTKIGDSLDINFSDLHKHFDFFLPLSGIEKQQFENENIADVKAANNMAKLYDEISKTNKGNIEKHDLNIFLSRLLFCYFAEDTNIFANNQFTESLASHTTSDGSDTHLFLQKLFEVFDAQERDQSLSEYLRRFPYVNGKLFQEIYEVPKFTTKSRNLLIELGTLDWSSINPDIFGSMMQAVMDEEERGNMGSHYTSVPNILKVIKPLFLDSLFEEFENSRGNQKRLTKLLERLGSIKFFDPACGSGNFLIITYKEIRRLEIEIMKEIGVGWTFGHSYISLSNFYGIEINDFAHETAKLSLYLAEHQMNVEFEKEVGISTDSLPLKLGGNIVCGNATRIDWEEVCPKNDGDEIYIMGNPPYLGARLQNKSQKKDMEVVFGDIKGYKNLDYISCRFYKGSKYITDFNSQYAFVTTNSLNQGEQVSLLRPHIFNLGLEISFGYTSFKWNNNAKGNAKVIVAIIGIRNKSSDKKVIFKDNFQVLAKNINAYIVDGGNVIVSKRSESLSQLPVMHFGSMANDGGSLTLSRKEYQDLIGKYTECDKIIKKFVGSKEYINHLQRYCIWINEDNKNIAFSIPEVVERINKCKNHRLDSDRLATKKLASKPYAFGEIRHSNVGSIIIPRVSSERREYIPSGYLDNTHVISDSALSISTNELRIMGIITSKMHMTWLRSVAGRLKSDYRYSASIVYNTFPFPHVTKKQKMEIEEHVYQVLDEREKHSEKTLAQMYDPDKMPDGLRNAHHQLDLAIERCYRPKPFESDEERLEYLFKMYEKMITKEQNSK